MIGSSRSTFSSRARTAMAVPMPSEPVSPMKIRAGAAFHQRKPAQAPIMAAAMAASSSGAGFR